jgi:hypothetical protein
MNTFTLNGVPRRASWPWFPLTGVPGFATSLISAGLKISARKRLENLVRAPAILGVVGSLVALADSSDRWVGSASAWGNQRGSC